MVVVAPRRLGTIRSQPRRRMSWRATSPLIARTDTLRDVAVLRRSHPILARMTMGEACLWHAQIARKTRMRGYWLQNSGYVGRVFSVPLLPRFPYMAVAAFALMGAILQWD
jgi:hypothetical protein